MADADDLETTSAPGYKAPQPKSRDELLHMDAEDESLNEYKRKLLGTGIVAPVFPNDKRKLIVEKLAISVEGRTDMEINLMGDISQLKKSPIVIKEGSKYRVKIYYFVQHDIVSGVKYVLAVYKGPLRVDKDEVMIGSYKPQKDPYVWVSSEEEAPKGILARGTYNVKSRFTDDDKFDYMTWEWAFKIKEDWSDK